MSGTLGRLEQYEFRLKLMAGNKIRLIVLVDDPELLFVAVNVSVTDSRTLG